MSVPDVFRRITAALDHVGISYMLSGSFASAHYGAPRSTQDIDLIIEATPEQLRALLQNMPSGQYYVDPDAALYAQSHESMFNVIDQATGWKIDFIIRKSRPFSREEFGRRQKVTLHGVSVVITTVEDTIISKLEWAKLGHSKRQIEDVAAILRVRWSSLDRTYLQRWIAELDLQAEWGSAKRASGTTD